MPLSRGLKPGIFIAVYSFFLALQPSYAIEESQPLHYSADRQVWDRKSNRVDLYDHAVVRQPGETLTADFITLDLNARILDAKGNCVYIASDTVIRGEEMHFNLDTRTGSIVGGRVANDRFSLTGERINKLGDSRYQTHWGEYSTCRDCPQTWTFTAEDVDMQVEGYAYLSNVTAKIKDAPAAWLPYLIIPMKTRRQTGFLFPTFGVSELNGVVFVLPFFWAISDSADMTVGIGEYTSRGRRVEWEGRYALTPRSGGQANFFYLGDKTVEAPKPDRWAFNLAQSQELPFGIEEKLRFTEVSDNLYPAFIGDVPGRSEGVLTSDLIFSRNSSDLSVYLAARRFRNLLNTNPDLEKRETEFDPHTVQVLPTAAVTTNDRILFGLPVAAGLTLGVTNFTRSAGPFDYDETSVPFGTDPGPNPPPFRPGIDPIREATRASVVPSLYTTIRPFGIFSLVPSLKYNAFFYSFPNESGMANLSRGYALFQADLSTQLEKVYDTNNPDIPRIKHLIRPILTYSYIPRSTVRPSEELPISEKHPFLQQIDNARGRGLGGYYFDNYDIVPFDTSPSNILYYPPLGNSLAYGFTTQLVRRRGRVDAESAEYQTMMEFSAGQSLNFLEYQKNKPDPQPLSRFFSVFSLNLDKYSTSSTYYYYPYVSKPRNALSTSHSYILERSTRQGILTFDRSLTLSYSYFKVVDGCQDDSFRECGTDSLTGTLNFSINDYVLPTLSSSYNFVTHQMVTTDLNLQFQSPSRCWKFTFNLSRNVDTKLHWGVDLALNLTGSGFGGVSEVSTRAMSR